MNWQEALNDIQSMEFDVNLNVVSSTDGFFAGVAREPAVLEAYDHMRNSGERREEALGMLFDLAWEGTDPRYENPNDTSLAVLLWLTNFATSDLVALAASWVDLAPRCWHAKRLAQRILNPPASMTGTVAEGPEPWGRVFNSRNVTTKSIDMEFRWAQSTRLAPGSHSAFPSRDSSTPDMTWSTSSEREVDHREGTA